MEKSEAGRHLAPIALFLALALPGCAGTGKRVTPETLQLACDQTSKTFAESADCMDGLLKDPELAPLRGDTVLQLYAAHASALAARVRSGRMLDAEARYQQAELLARIARERQARADAAGDAMLRYYIQSERFRAAAAAQVVTCTKSGASVICF